MQIPKRSWTVTWTLTFLIGTALTLQLLSGVPDSEIVADLLLRIQALAFAIGAVVVLAGIATALGRREILRATERGLAASACLLVLVFLLADHLTRLVPGIAHPELLSSAARGALFAPTVVVACFLPAVIRGLGSSEGRGPQKHADSEWSSTDGAVKLQPLE